MARQLVFTSAPQGLTPGRTGYCTVARHRDLRERLVPVLESLSQYPSDWQPSPTIYTFRQLELAGARFPVLTRIVEAGHDYTHRSNFLAHHLILDPEEMTGAPSPAEIFLRWPGWLNRWDGPARWLDETDLVNLAALPSAPNPALPARTWGLLAGDAGRAALLTGGQQSATRLLRVNTGQESEIIYLFRESSALLPTVECWRTEFTTCLQPAETASSFRWTGVRVDSPGDKVPARANTLLDLTQPSSLPAAPATPSTRLAREGPLQASKPSASTRTSSAPTLALTNKSGADKARPGNTYSPPKPGKPAAANNSNAILYSVIATACVILVGAVIIFWPRSPTLVLPPVSNVPPVAPMPVFKPEPAPDTTPVANNPAPTATNVAITNEQVLSDIQQLAKDGKYLDAVSRWQSFARDAADFTQSHIDVLKSQLLPGARKEWLAALDKIVAQLADGSTPRADVVGQLASLHDFPRLWPVTNPDELTQAEAVVQSKINFLGELPDAPVWIVDDLATTSTGTDYQDATISLSIPELDALMKGAVGKFHVSAAPALSVQLPQSAQWFNFDIKAPDFSSGDFLILQDASRGEAGGRYLQLLVEAPGKTRLTWRMFQPQSDIFQRFPANAPLRPASRLLWLHFAGEAPLPSFYLLLRRPDNVVALPWKPLALPISWLNTHGAPALVSLPHWLANNLRWHTLPGQSLHLEPTLQDSAIAELAPPSDKTINTPAAVQYDASTLVILLAEKIRNLQTDLARAQQQWSGLQSATDRRAAQPAIDQAAETVKILEHNIQLAQNAAQAISGENWPQTASRGAAKIIQRMGLGQESPVRLDRLGGGVLQFEFFGQGGDFCPHGLTGSGVGVGGQGNCFRENFLRFGDRRRGSVGREPAAQFFGDELLGPVINIG